jgi:hypothetical protein
MGFIQRQGAGKFTRTEVDTFIERLREADFGPATSVVRPDSEIIASFPQRPSAHVPRGAAAFNVRPQMA